VGMLTSRPPSVPNTSLSTTFLIDVCEEENPAL
jgi:hypothetical protein